MIRLAVDENFKRAIVQGLLRRKPDLDIVSVRDAGLASSDDPTVLEWAAGEGRLVLTHDVSTMTYYAYQRAERGLAMPGVIEVTGDAGIGALIDGLLLLVECSREGEWEGQVIYLRNLL